MLSNSVYRHPDNQAGRLCFRAKRRSPYMHRGSPNSVVDGKWHVWNLHSYRKYAMCLLDLVMLANEFHVRGATLCRHRQLRIAQYRPAIHEVQAQLSMRRCLQLPDASADGGLGTGLGNGTGSAQTSTGVHAVSDAGTMVLHGHDSGGLILCTIPSFGQQCGSAGDDHAQQDGSTPLSDLPSRSLSLTAHPELPVYASQDCNILARACTQVAPEVRCLHCADSVTAWSLSSGVGHVC